MTELAIRGSFVNCTKGEARRLPIPKDLDERPWHDLDFLGWQDPSATQRAYLVAESDPGLVGVALRVATQQGHIRRSMCSICLTTHTGNGVSLMTARKAGPNGRLGNSVGIYACTDLACSLYLRGQKKAGRHLDETLTLSARIERTTTNLAAFLHKILS
ncbi:FBP domain-containing protein [Phytohabitans flavus]|uniref:Elongation factor G-binding protein C-terminal treble-clef zinc-finger domain-containing protein n=2 Tax=Phytohabitans flavus TaxID=1076124 RepID=A0A6F8XX45_9ACTN|nr:hypothetical protein Pflav_047180 [Phytohabitans flavus]